MENNFSSPQRQSLIGVVVMFADTFQGAARALWPVLFVWILRINQMSKFYLWTGIAVILILVAVIAYLKYRNFTFFLDEDNEEFIVNKGILNKTRIAIPLDKIQQVNINQSLIQKIIGVHALEVDTAGSSGKEATIRAIRHDLALSLKERLLETGHAPQSAESGITTASAEINRPFIQISLISLLKTGITSNYARSFALLIAFVATTFQYVEDYIEVAGYDEDPLDEYINPKVMLRFIAVIIVGIIIITLVINLVRTIFRYFDYRITKQHDSLLLSYGLINTKNTILRPRKVQIVAIARNYFQKKLNINDLRIRQASGVDSSSDKAQQQTAIEIPGCNDNEKDALLKFLLGSIPEKGVIIKPNIRKIIIESVKFLVIPLGVFCCFTFFLPELYEYMLLVPAYILFVGLLIYFAFRHNRLFVTDDFIIKQSGAWDVSREYIAPHKIQSVSLTQFFWHKSADIGIVSLHTAGGSVSFGLANYTKLKELVNQWVYQVETSDKNWM